MPNDWIENAARELRELFNEIQDDGMPLDVEGVDSEDAWMEKKFAKVLHRHAGESDAEKAWRILRERGWYVVPSGKASWAIRLVAGGDVPLTFSVNHLGGGLRRNPVQLILEADQWTREQEGK